MWADTLLRAEQQHLLRLLLWSALSLVVATGLGVFLAARRIYSPLLRHFALQTAAWGIVVASLAAVGWHGAHLRDVSGMTRLERLLWLNLGLDAGLAALGVVLAVTGWALGRKMSFLGAGTAIVVQGLALLVINLQFAAVISR